MSYIQIILAFIIIIFSLLLTLTLTLVPSKNSPLLPWNWPLLKLLPTAYFKGHQLYDKLTRVLAENKGTILLRTSWYTSADILVTSDPRNVHHILNSKFSIYQRGFEFRKAFDFLGDAVFVKDIDEWKEGKKFTHGFYKESDFQNSTPRIILHTLEKGLIPILDDMSKENRVFDFQDLFNRYMIDATCILATGFDIASLRVELPQCPLLDAMDGIADAVFWRNILPEGVWKLQSYLGIGREKKMAEACRSLNQILDDFVSRKLELAKNNRIGDNFDVLKFYMAGESRSKEFLAINMMTLFFAGRDTSACILTWFFHLISTNPRVKNAILEEIKRDFPNQEKHVFSDVEELKKLVYLQSALTETLRLFPPVPVIIRDPLEDDVLPSGHRLRKSTRIMLCSYAMGREKEIWGEDCGEFRPERWMCEKGGMKHVASHNFLSFGSGPWACPGRELAFARMKAVAATILHNFDVDVLEGQSASPSVSALLAMRYGLKARVSSKWM